MAAKNAQDGEQDIVLKGTTLSIFRFIFRQGRSIGPREIQRGLNLSSVSIATYHLTKLLEAGLIRETGQGYVVDRRVFENAIRIRRLLIPFQVSYVVFFAMAIVMLLTILRAQKRRVIDIVRQLDVSIDAVERWLRAYRRRGIEGIKARKPTGRPARKRRPAEARIRELLRQDPQAFGFLKGRWVVRDIATALSQEGVEVSKSYVQDMLKGLGLAYKRPKLDVRSNDPNYYRKAREVGNYKQAASMLAKRGSSSHSRTRPGPRSTRASKPSG